jgi:hypothetical protein
MYERNYFGATYNELQAPPLLIVHISSYAKQLYIVSSEDLKRKKLGFFCIASKGKSKYSLVVP